MLLFTYCIATQIASVCMHLQQQKLHLISLWNFQFHLYEVEYFFSHAGYIQILFWCRFLLSFTTSSHTWLNPFRVLWYHSYSAIWIPKATHVYCSAQANMCNTWLNSWWLLSFPLTYGGISQKRCFDIWEEWSIFKRRNTVVSANSQFVSFSARQMKVN